MLTEYTTPGASVEVRDDESIYSLLTERIKRTGEDYRLTLEDENGGTSVWTADEDAIDQLLEAIETCDNEDAEEIDADEDEGPEQEGRVFLRHDDDLRQRRR